MKIRIYHTLKYILQFGSYLTLQYVLNQLGNTFISHSSLISRHARLYSSGSRRYILHSLRMLFINKALCNTIHILLINIMFVAETTHTSKDIDLIELWTSRLKNHLQIDYSITHSPKMLLLHVLHVSWAWSKH